MIVDGAYRIEEVCHAVREKSRRRRFEGFRDDRPHFFEQDGGCEVARIAPAHAIGYGKNEVMHREGVTTGRRQDFRTGCPGGKCHEGVVVLRFARSALAAGRPADRERWWLGHGVNFLGRWVFACIRSGGGQNQAGWRW